MRDLEILLQIAYENNRPHHFCGTLTNISGFEEGIA
jgi:hypothetical protein